MRGPASKTKRARPDFKKIKESAAGPLFFICKIEAVLGSKKEASFLVFIWI